MRLYEKGVKWISSAILLLLTIYVGTFSINLGAFAKDNSDVIYVTERANTKDNTYVRYNNNDTRVANKVIGPDNIDEISNDEVNNICVDGNLIDKENIRQTLLNKYNSHSTIIIRKDDYTPKEIYDYFGESELSSLVTDSPYNDIKNNKLKVVAISIRKDYSGGVHATVISVENYNSEEAIEKAISYTILSKTNYSKEEKIVSLFEFNNNVYAASWNNVNTLAWSDSWDTVNVSFSITLKKYSDNPVSSKYYFLIYTPIDIEPTSSFYVYRDVYISHYTLTNQNATISPVATTNTSTISVSFSVPISFSASTTIGVSTGIQKYSGGIGSDCIQWNFYPCVLGAKTYSPNASHYICASEYTQPGNHYYGYINYSFQMYERSGSGATPYQYVDNDNGTSGY